MAAFQARAIRSSAHLDVAIDKHSRPFALTISIRPSPDA
jgi:hypothetical protein